MFKSARIKLTIWYLLIIMAISIVFSLVIYRVQEGEASRLLQRQRVEIERGGLVLSGPRLVFEPQILTEAEDRLKTNLVLINLAVLILAGGAAYFLSGQTLKPIEEMVNEQRRFVADASHELRTPLTTMKTETEVALRNKSLQAESKELLASNLDEIDRLTYLSDKLLRLSRYEQNGVKIEKISLQEVLTEVVKKAAKTAKMKQIKINENLSEVSLQGDKDALIEAFGTILDNAIKYSPQGSEVNVSLNSQNQKAVIKIQDFGIGIKAVDFPLIFNRFYRADTARTKEKIDGFGLGLSIAKKVIDKHNGKIEVESSTNKGTTFTVFLPLSS